MANLEEKMDANVRRDLVNDWAYIAAAAAKPNEPIKVGEQELPVTYAHAALEKLADTAKSVKEQGYLRAILASATTDLQQHGTYTKPTQEALTSLAQGYKYALFNSPVQEVTGLAKKLGYSESLPEFLLSYKGTFKSMIEENAEKAKKGDERAKAVMNAIQLTQQVIELKAKDGLRDYILGQNFNQLGAIYNDPEKFKEAMKKAKANKEAKKPEEPEEED